MIIKLEKSILNDTASINKLLSYYRYSIKAVENKDTLVLYKGDKQ